MVPVPKSIYDPDADFEIDSIDSYRSITYVLVEATVPVLMPDDKPHTLKLGVF